MCIDPQTQANRYIKKLSEKFTGNNYSVVKQSNKNLIRTMENGVRFGKWVLMENVGETMDAALEPILQRNVFKQGGQDMIRLGKFFFLEENGGGGEVVVVVEVCDWWI